MHLLALIAVVLAIVGIALVLLAFALSGPRERRRRVALGLLGVGSLLMTGTIWAVLKFAEPEVCEALGGESVVNADERVCRNEWGGNGNNDPGTSWVPWA
jgi:hypothetical protein